jgi:hypothetical protein
MLPSSVCVVVVSRSSVVVVPTLGVVQCVCLCALGFRFFGVFFFFFFAGVFQRRAQVVDRVALWWLCGLCAGSSTSLRS